MGIVRNGLHVAETVCTLAVGAILSNFDHFPMVWLLNLVQISRAISAELFMVNEVLMSIS